MDDYWTTEAARLAALPADERNRQLDAMPPRQSAALQATIAALGSGRDVPARSDSPIANP